MYLLILILNLFAPVQEDPVLKPVRDLFNGMAQGDSTLARNAFTKDATMTTVVVGDNGTEIRKGSVDRFVSFVGTLRENQVNEPIWGIKIEKDGVFAQVWVDYALYAEGKFVHCGVDAFHLAKIDGSWKIFALTDTRRKNNCEVPEEVSKQYVK